MNEEKKKSEGQMADCRWAGQIKTKAKGRRTRDPQ